MRFSHERLCVNWLLPIVCVGCASPSIGNAVADNGEAFIASRQQGFYTADEIPGRCQ